MEPETTLRGRNVAPRGKVRVEGAGESAVQHGQPALRSAPLPPPRPPPAPARAINPRRT
jgi:hypothetical protein